MKPSDLPKDRKDTLRVNTEVKEALKARGLSLQTVLDNALDALLGDIDVLNAMAEKHNTKPNIKNSKE